MSDTTSEAIVPLKSGSINTQTLFDNKALKFSVSSGSTTYQQLFMESLTKTLTDMQNVSGMPALAALPTDISTDIALSPQFYSVISAGLDFYLQDSNVFTANPIPDAEARFQRALAVTSRIYRDSQPMYIRFGNLESYSIGLLQSEGFVG